MAKKVTQKDLRELIAMCIKKVFPEDDNEGHLPNLSQFEKGITIDSIYVEIPDSGKYTKRDIMKLNKYFRRYAGKNLVCKYCDKDKNVLIIKNDYQVIE